MHVAYIKGEPTKPVKPSRKERVEKLAEELERKWRARDREKAIKKNEERIKKLGMTPEQVRRALDLQDKTLLAKESQPFKQRTTKSDLKKS